MSTTKNRHIQESNLIIEKRFLQTEGLFIDRKLPQDVVDNSLKLSILLDPSNSTKYKTLLSNPSKGKYGKWSNRNVIYDSLKLSKEWCNNTPTLPGMSEDDVVNFPCIEVEDYLSGESGSMLSGFLGMFGNLV